MGCSDKWQNVAEPHGCVVELVLFYCSVLVCGLAVRSGDFWNEIGLEKLFHQMQSVITLQKDSLSPHGSCGKYSKF